MKLKELEKIPENVIQHMLGYIEEDDQTGNDVHDLGYLDTHHWVDAVKVLEERQLDSLKALAKVVDSQYNTSFFSDIEEAIKEKPVYENTCKFSGNISKTDFYLILDYIDQMKQRGWFILKNDRTEDADYRVTFDYQLAKN